MIKKPAGGNRKPVTNVVEHVGPLVTKYGPVTVHQSGTMSKELAATPTPVVGAKSHVAHSLQNVRLSMHIERFDAVEKFSEDIKCVTRFPEFGYELKHNAPCDMRAGQTHGAAVVQATCISLDWENAHDTEMEVEFFLGEESLEKMTMSVKYPSKNEPLDLD